MAPNYDYDSDDVADYDGDDYAEEEELSPEDKASMDQGTADVRKALGSDASKVTTKQIHDSLWHYYYDVEKTVSYLRKTYLTPAPKPPPKKAPEGTFGQFSFFAASPLCQRTTGADDVDFGKAQPETLQTSSDFGETGSFPLKTKIRLDHSLDFSDMPWLNVPQHRQAVLVAPVLPRGGLLGGGDGAPPKMSKLQALAAARKKKSEAQKEPPKAFQPENGLQNLHISDEQQKENMPPTNPLKRQKLSGKSTLSGRQVEDAREQEKPKMEFDEPLTATPAEPPATVERDQVVVATPRPTPSGFATTLLGSAPAKSTAQRRDAFPFPYASSTSFHASAFLEPSPDDIVLAAQAKAGKKAPATKPAAKPATKASGKEAETASGVANLKLNDAPPPKSKGLDVLKEFENSQSKRSVSFVVVGHVDAGKSTLMGRLLVELKFVEERTVEKYRRLAEKSGKQSFALAWVMDQRSEERDRGVTIDIATNHFESETTKYTILDAPGHRDFIPNMIAGASQADFAILVIDANTGAYEKGLKGQTREHVLLLRSLGVQRIIVAVNKLDMVGWSKDRFEEINQQVSGFLTGLGFQDKHISFIPISGLNGDNIAKSIEDEAASWYTGTTLVGALEDSGPSAARALTKPFRMTISEVFRSQQGTTTLAGRIDSGTIQIGEVLLVQPSGEHAYIKSIMVDTDAQEWAVAGQSVSIALTDIDPIHIRVGDILCHTTDAISCSDTLTMKAMAFEHLMPMPVDLHRGRLHAAGQIQSIAATLDKSTGQIIKKKPKIVQPGGVARVSIKLGSKVPLEAGQRVVIRSAGETIAAGLIE